MSLRLSLRRLRPEPLVLAAPPEPAGHGEGPSRLHGLRQVAQLTGKSLNSKYLQKRARIVVVFPQHVHNIKWRMLQQCNTRWRVGGTRGSTVTLQCKVLYVAETGGMLPQSVELRWSGDGLRRASAIGLGRRCWRRPTPWRVSLLQWNESSITGGPTRRGHTPHERSASAQQCLATYPPFLTQLQPGRPNSTVLLRKHLRGGLSHGSSTWIRTGELTGDATSRRLIGSSGSSWSWRRWGPEGEWLRRGS